MDVSGISNTGQTADQAAALDKTLGKDEFLRLLTAQLRAQDPLNPMDSAGFTAQLAQFSSLEQLTNINTQLTGVLASQNSLQSTMTTDLIGKKVAVNGSLVQLNGQADLQYHLSADAAKVTVSIYDSKGALVRTEELANQAAGDRTYAWNGADSNGNSLPPGAYNFMVEAAGASGQAIGATPLNFGTVTGVTFANNETYLNIDGTMRVRLEDIIEIQGGI
jgi:flagellar basal-body rod modification protein FlgD